jgi:hypothetical protein
MICKFVTKVHIRDNFIDDFLFVKLQTRGIYVHMWPRGYCINIKSQWTCDREKVANIKKVLHWHGRFILILCLNILHCTNRIRKAQLRWYFGSWFPQNRLRWGHFHTYMKLKSLYFAFIIYEYTLIFAFNVLLSIHKSEPPKPRRLIKTGNSDQRSAPM